METARFGGTWGKMQEALMMENEDYVEMTDDMNYCYSIRYVKQ